MVKIDVKIQLLTKVQFGLVHHFNKLGSGEYYLEELEEEVCPKHKRDNLEEKQRQRSASLALIQALRTVYVSFYIVKIDLKIGFQASFPNNRISENNLSEIGSQSSLYTLDTRMVDLDMWSQNYSLSDVGKNNFLNHFL